jgi:hypothetical protein
MGTNRSALAEAYHLLRQDLYGHLDEAEYLAMKYEPWTDQDLDSALVLIPNLVTVIRGVVALHDTPDPVTDPRCRTCDESWPCEAFETIHRLVKDPDREFVRLVTRARQL